MDKSLMTIEANSEGSLGLANMLKEAEILIQSGVLPVAIKKPETLVAIMQQGKELGIPPMMAINNLFIVSGKVAMSASLVGSLAYKAGVTWKILENCVSVLGDDGKVIDKRTTIQFKRGGETNDIAYTWKDAERAGYTTKDNWQKFPKNMLFNRCLVMGIRMVAPDALSGVYEVTEIADNSKGVSLVLNDEGTVTAIQEAEVVK